MLNIFDNLLDGVLVFTKDQNLVYVNDAFGNLVEIPSRRMKPGKKVQEFAHLPVEFWNKIAEISGRHEPTPYAEIIFQSASGKPVKVQYSAQIFEYDLKPTYLVYFKDISLELVLQEKYKNELLQKEDYIKQLDQKLFDVSFLLDISSLINATGSNDESILNRVLRKTNQTFQFKSAYFINAEENKTPLQFKVESYVDQYKSIEDGSITSDIVNRLNPYLQNHLYKEDPFTVNTATERFTIVGIQSKNSTMGYLIFEQDLKRSIPKESDMELIKAMARQIAVTFDNEILYYKSITDEKTKLYNARYFASTLKSEVHRSLRNQSPFGLLLVDIDHFKKFNDTYGHQVGDLVLKHVALQIKAAIRNTDIAARYGGEEFAVMLMDTPIEGIKIAAERVRTSIETMGLKTEEFGVLKVTASVGVAICPMNAASDKDLLEAADRALYHAKRVGRNNVQHFDPNRMPAIS